MMVFSGGNVLFHVDMLHFLFPETRDFPEDVSPQRTLLLFLEKQFWENVLKFNFHKEVNKCLSVFFMSCSSALTI